MCEMRMKVIISMLLCGMVILLWSKTADAMQAGGTESGQADAAGVTTNPELVIALDPGHGGEENGAWYYGLKEKDANLRIAELVREELLAYPNVTVVLTRDGDEEIGLLGRVIRAADAGADVFVSLHLNASVSHKSEGATVYVTTAERYRTQVCDMADCLLGEFEALGLNNNGTVARVTQMGGRRNDGSFDDYYGVLRHAYNYGMPAVLIEHCFMDAEKDRPFLETEEGLRRLAVADANGIAAYYGLARTDGSRAAAKHAKVKGGTTRGTALNSFAPPNVNGIRLLEYEGTTPGIATYQVEVTDENSVSSLYLVYKNQENASFTVLLTSSQGLTTGTHEVKAYIPAFLAESDYTLSYIGASNEAGYDAGYNNTGGTMLGFGKCEWLNSFEYHGEADIAVTGTVSVSTVHARWLEYEIEAGLRNRRDRCPAILYPD